MISNLFTKLFGSRNDRTIKNLRKTVALINALETQLEALSDEDLRAKTAEFRERYDNGQGLDDILPEAFAVVREASKRVNGMRHFDVQLLGGMVLHQGRIAEMRTGEGKITNLVLTTFVTTWLLALMNEFNVHYFML